MDNKVFPVFENELDHKYKIDKSQKGVMGKVKKIMHAIDEDHPYQAITASAHSARIITVTGPPDISCA